MAVAAAFLLLAWRGATRWKDRPAVGFVDSRSPVAVSAPLAPAASMVPAVGRARWVATTNLAGDPVPDASDPRHPFRLRNAAGSAGSFGSNPRAVVLRNAFVDTAGPALGVPAALRSEDPGAWVIQSAGVVDSALRARLADAGLTVVSYIPNNSLLVLGDRDAAARAAQAPEVGAVLPFEPYFKLDPSLVSAALHPDTAAALRLTVGVVDASTAASLASLGAVEFHRERGPFATMISVEAPASALAAIAGLKGVQLVEPAQSRRLANDRAGYLLGSTTNVDNTGSYLGLTGKGVLVNINDSGVDAMHPDLTGRVSSVPGATNAAGVNLLTDPDGHGTHVAGIIAGNGSQSASLSVPPQGSVSNANFQGKAPEAELFVLPVDLIQGPPAGDDFLQETAANAPGRPDLSEPLISNNSWAYFSGFGPDTQYDSHSASYDAAVRDALPGTTGDQPILYVFAAGNFGNGGDNGIGGDFDTVSAPGNAKNVITVGALESARMLTNSVILDSNGVVVWAGSTSISPITTNGVYTTNQVYLGLTDTDYEVASFSSRGNVGIGTEGDSGRFKPDVVAPGVFTISTRSSLWQVTNEFNPAIDPIDYDLTLDLVKETAPWYRYESGTSMATPAISGLLAQMQEFFRKSGNGPSPSAAGYKALVINSSYITSSTYNPDPHSTDNYAGWGEPYLPFALSTNVALSSGSGRSLYVLQSDDAAVTGSGGASSIGLATGESVSFRLVLQTNAVSSPVHLTLVWTDPPGNPVAASKLVNDLDVVVSNEVTGDVFIGNYYDANTGMSAIADPHVLATNSAVFFDRLNNVERIDFDPAGDASFIVTVHAHLVNVNARRDHPDATVQDFALAVRSDYFDASGAASGAITPVSSSSLAVPGLGEPPIIALTNGAALLNERVGANSPLLNSPYGQTNQWRFYIFTNSPGITSNGDLVLTNGSNVAFVTFPVGNLSRARTNDPDIDLYVSFDSTLTNLNPAAIAGAFKSVGRGASELVYFTNAPVKGEVYYVGVKSEDQQAAEYGFLGISTDQPFTTLVNGVPRPLAIPLIQPIPDGTPNKPGKGVYMAISVMRQRLRLVTAGVTTSHQRFEDLIGKLSHNKAFAVLNNHGRIAGLDYGTNVTVTYDDTHTRPKSSPSDGPGNLISFLGYGATGPWFLTTVDNAKGNTGRINRLDLGMVPNDFGESFVNRCVGGGGYDFEVIIVPADASRLTVTITNMTPALPLEVYIKREDIPDVTNPANDDKYAFIRPPGGSISIGTGDSPPLLAGRYFILIHNPNSVQVCFDIRGHLDIGLDSKFTRVFTTSNAVPLADMARTILSLNVDDGRPVTAAQVGLLARHPRVSDLSVRVFNPQGQGAVVVENRGGDDPGGFGGPAVTTNGTFSHAAISWSPSLHRAALYVNGSLSAQGDFPDLTINTTNDLYFAADPSGRVIPAVTALSVDDFGFWSTPLLPQQVRAIYTDGIAGLGKTGPDHLLGLAALWPFDGTGDDLFGKEYVGLQGFHVTVPGVVGQAVRFASVTALGRAPFGSDINPGTAAGFTIDGWADASSGAATFVAGFGGAGDPSGPAILANAPAPFGGGPGTMSAFLGFRTNGTPRVLVSPAGSSLPNAKVTNNVYAVFQDDTNNPVAQLIKFAKPPFQSDIRSRLLAESGFETNNPGFLFPGGLLLDNWTVASGVVQQLYDGAVAYDGDGFIAMQNAEITRSFDVRTNRTYIASFAHRLPPSPNGNPAGVDFIADGTVLDTVTPTTIWQTNAYVITPTNTPLVLSLRTITNAADATLIDDFRLVETTSSIYLPEEPFDPLIGLPGIGAWTLEVNDTRIGEVGTLDSWQLSLTFGATNPPAVTLTNGLDYQTNIAGSTIQYFIVNVPPEATAANNFLQSITGGPLNLLFNQNALPDGTQPDDYLLMSTTGTTGQSAQLVPSLIPPLVPGQRYYLGVQNANAGDSNVFDIRVDFAIPVTVLTNGSAVTATNANTGLIDYYSFDVPREDIKVLFSLTNMSADVNLVVAKAPTFPTRSQYDYSSTQPGTTPDFIAIDVNSQPTPLTPGKWYVGVYSAGAPPLTPIRYTLSVTTFTDGLPLTNGVPLSATNFAGVDYFYIDVPAEAFGAFFALTNLSKNADLYVRKGMPVPGVNRYDYASVNFGVVNDTVSVYTNSQPVPLSAGRWYMAVVPVDPSPITYSILAQYDAANGYTDLTNGIPLYGTLPSGPWNQAFRFIAPTNTSGILFELYNLSGPADLYAAFGVLPEQSPNPLASQMPDLSPEVIVVRTNTATNDLAGTYYVEVRGTNSTSAYFTIRAATEVDGLLVSGQDTMPTPVSVLGPGTPPTDIQFNAVPGEYYQLQYLTVLPPNNVTVPWNNLPPAYQAPGVNGSVSVPSAFSTTNTTVFFRIVQVVAP
jgi:subtilisin-like proprotein convertase family protein